MANTINSTSSAIQVNTFLQQLAETNPLVQVITKEICSRNAASRTAEFGKDCAGDYETCTVAAARLRQTGALFMLASRPNIVWVNTHAYRRGHPDLTPAALAQLRAQHAQGAADWHCFGVLVRKNVMYIYDSAYPNLSNPDLVLPPTQPHQIGHFANLNMARTLLREIYRAKSRGAITALYIGGGGNVKDMNDCRAMTAQWLEQVAGLVQAAEAAKGGEGEQLAGTQLAGFLAQCGEKILE